VQLTVPETQHAAALAAFAPLTGVTVHACPQLAHGQALLDNGLVRVRIDWPAYRDKLLRQLAGTDEGVADD